MKTLGRMLVVLVGIALAGCSGTSSENNAPITLAAVPSAPTASASTTASPSPISQPSPPAPAQANNANPVQGDPCADPSINSVGLAGLDFNRYAKICLGMSFATASSTMLGPPINGDSACPWFASILEIDDPGLYVAAVTDPANPGAAISLFRMTWLGDPSAAAAFDAPATPAGITVGSTSAEVKAAYPAAKAVSLDDPARGTRNQLVVSGPGGTAFAFDVTEGLVTDIYWGNGVSQGAGGELCAL